MDTSPNVPKSGRVVSEDFQESVLEADLLADK